jgi:hypothetical protein
MLNEGHDGRPGIIENISLFEVLRNATTEEAYNIKKPFSRNPKRKLDDVALTADSPVASSPGANTLAVPTNVRLKQSRSGSVPSALGKDSTKGPKAIKIEDDLSISGDSRRSSWLKINAEVAYKQKPQAKNEDLMWIQCVVLEITGTAEKQR